MRYRVKISADGESWADLNQWLHHNDSVKYIRHCWRYVEHYFDNTWWSSHENVQYIFMLATSSAQLINRMSLDFKDVEEADLTGLKGGDKKLLWRCINDS